LSFHGLAQVDVFLARLFQGQLGIGPERGLALPAVDPEPVDEVRLAVAQYAEVEPSAVAMAARFLIRRLSAACVSFGMRVPNVHVFVHVLIWAAQTFLDTCRRARTQP
jgi:hypothetical protein